MGFKAIQKTVVFTQTNMGSREQVFPLLCPSKELEWMDGWKFTMIHSKSGVAEKDCVFTTPSNGNCEVVWQITHHNPADFTLEMVRLTPQKDVVKIDIELEKVEDKITRTKITYQYTGLTAEQNYYIQNQMELDFVKSMQWWEKSINHFLETGTKLLR